MGTHDSDSLARVLITRRRLVPLAGWLSVGEAACERWDMCHGVRGARTADWSSVASAKIGVAVDAEADGGPGTVPCQCVSGDVIGAAGIAGVQRVKHFCAGT